MQSAQLGDIRLDVVPDGTFKLDGGQMFSVVPKVLWEKHLPADDLNRVDLGLNVLLIRTSRETILVDTGVGGCRDEIFMKRYGRSPGNFLSKSLLAAGVTPDRVTHVVNTHLHFDHAGGNSTISGGRRTPAFPNARYVVQRGEYEHALAPFERDRGSYIAADFEIVAERGLFDFVDGDAELAPGVSLLKVGGHNRDMQCVKVQSGGRTAFAFADMVPTTAHLSPAWMMSFDLYPTDVLERKKQWLAQAAEEEWIGIFYHDPVVAMGRVVTRQGKTAVMSDG